MNQTIEQRMLNIEQELSEILYELEESLARYKDRDWLRKDIPQFFPMTPEQFQVMIDQLWGNEK